MSGHDKLISMDNCTSAFVMSIDQPDVKIIMRIGCPPSLESLVQEYGRAGKDGWPAKGKKGRMFLYVYKHRHNIIGHYVYFTTQESYSIMRMTFNTSHFGQKVTVILLIRILSHGGNACYRKLHVLYNGSLFRFVFAHLEGKCRREIMLQYFDEDTEEQPLTTTCCDICNCSVEKKDFLAEINVIIQTIAEFSDIGEKM